MAGFDVNRQVNTALLSDDPLQANGWIGRRPVFVGSVLRMTGLLRNFPLEYYGNVRRI